MGFVGRNPQPQPGEEDAQLIKLADEPRAIGEVFNIGNTGEVAIGDLARHVVAVRDQSVLEQIDAESDGLDGVLDARASTLETPRQRSC